MNLEGESPLCYGLRAELPHCSKQVRTKDELLRSLSDMLLADQSQEYPESPLF